MLCSARWNRLFVAASLSLLVIACGGEEQPGVDDNQNQQNSQANQQNDGNDEANDNGDNADNDGNNDARLDDPQDDCEEAIDRFAEFEIPLPDGTEGFGAPKLARVGDELWVTYLAAVDIGEETPAKAHLMRLECDGEPIDEPRRLGRDEPVDDSPASMGTDGTIVYIAWSDVFESEEGGFMSQIRGMTFDTDGTRRHDEPFSVEFDVDGEPVVDLRNPDVDVDHNGNAVLVAEQPAGFSSYALFQRIDDQGAAVGDGIYLDADSGDGQAGPVVSVRDDNSVLFAYIEETVMHGTISSTGDSVDEGPEGAEPTIGGGNDPGFVDLSKNRGGGNTWMAYPLGTSANNTVVVRTGTLVGLRDGENSSVSERASQQVSVTASENGGAKAWVSSDGGAGIIHFRRFQGSASDTSHAGPIIDEHDEGEAIGGPDITWLTDEIFAAVWPEEEGLVGRIIDFEHEEESM